MAKSIERVYTVPLRKEYQKAPRWNRTKKATKALKEFLAKHMKSNDVRISNNVNEELWKDGIKNPPHHIKVTVTKDEKGVVKADLFGAKAQEEAKAAPKKKAAKKKTTAAKKE